MTSGEAGAKVETAVGHFVGGYNCAESALLALGGEQARVQGELQRLATAFGGGTARRGMLCGAVAGAAMSLGLHLGRSLPGDSEGRDRVYHAAEELMAAVEARFGSVQCRQLTGLDFHDPGSHDAFPPVKERVCIPLLRYVVELTARRIAGD
ncbi:MAG TPA: C-GCAxxG-C-C family protein [Thermoanaerobaculaceae bacterium]|nr:C-GCAxxG-C-C family protein [Thermoanaerobaculaceae bacterium]HPS76838.1 C-GCAxxG-C-C family protein [Thermoanaerobaculaceae bacterium]